MGFLDAGGQVVPGRGGEEKITPEGWRVNGIRTPLNFKRHEGFSNILFYDLHVASGAELPKTLFGAAFYNPEDYESL